MRTIKVLIIIAGFILGFLATYFLVWYSGTDLDIFVRNENNVFRLIMAILTGAMGVCISNIINLYIKD
jgi:cytochrome c biogenesis protein CcdA